ncbi:MAG: mevalonate kinase [Bradymonadaceae bacterium]
MSDRSVGKGRGNGKLILYGEHLVVYGEPAVVAALPRGVRARASRAQGGASELVLDDGGVPEPDSPLARAFEAILDAFDDRLDGPVRVEMETEIPVGVGLGSSAATSAAIARSLADLAGGGPIEAAVDRAEGVFHGSPSGIDRTAALDSGLHFYRPGDGDQIGAVDGPPFRVGVVLAGEPASTSEMVASVREFRARNGSLFEHLLQLVGDVARSASDALSRGDRRRAGELMDVNHGALASLGVTTPALDEACHVARAAGALGAKLTGAGGGGCAVAMLPDGDHGVLDAWRREGWEAFEATLGDGST